MVLSCKAVVLKFVVLMELFADKTPDHTQSILASIVDGTDDAIFSTTLEGAITSWNKGAEKLFGFTRTEALGKQITSLLPTDRIDEAETILERLKKGESIDHFETERLRKDGIPVYISLRISPLLDAQSNIAGIAQIARDFTKQRKSRETFKALLESAPDAMVIVGGDGKIQMVNEQTERLFLYKRAELIGNKVEILIPQRYTQNHPEHRKSFFSDPRVRGMGIDLELYGKRKDDTEFPVEISLSPLETEAGVVALAAIRDISLRKKSEEKFKALLESAPDAMLIVGQDGNIQMVNAQVRNIFQFERGEILGKPVEILIPERFHHAHPHHRQGFFKDPRMRGMGIGLELYGKRKDGTEFPVEISLSPLETEEGTLALAAIRDITERKKAEQQIQQLNRELEEHIVELESFSYSVSHDLRAPLRAIDGFIAMFMDKFQDTVDPEGKRLLGNIRRNVTKMSNLINDLLMLSRIGAKDIDRTFIDMKTLVNSVLDEFRSTHSHATVQVSDLHPAFGDIALMRQVFLNLISNAFKYSSKKEQPYIEIGSVEKTGEIQYYIKDNGVGFDMEYYNKLFGVFQRLHSPQDYNGTGVGLAIVKRVITRHGGLVWAEGEEGIGATFYFTLNTTTHGAS
jgi:PAS domain S-box-containing protein